MARAMKAAAARTMVVLMGGSEAHAKGCVSVSEDCLTQRFSRDDSVIQEPCKNPYY